MYGSRRGAAALSITTIIFAALFMGTSLYGYLLWQKIEWTEQRMQSAGLDEFVRRVENGKWTESERKVDETTQLLTITYSHGSGGVETVKNIEELKSEIQDLEKRRHELGNVLGFGYRSEGRADYNLLSGVLNRLAKLEKQGTDEAWFSDLAAKTPYPTAIDLSLSGAHGGVVTVERNPDGKEQSRKRTLTIDPTMYDLQGKAPSDDTTKIVYTYEDVIALETPYTVEDFVNRLSNAIAGDGGLHSKVQSELGAIKTKWGHPDDLDAKFADGWSLVNEFFPSKDGVVWTDKMSAAQRQKWQGQISKEGFFGLQCEFTNSLISAEEARREVDNLQSEAISQYKQKFDEIFGTWNYKAGVFQRKNDGVLVKKRTDLDGKMEEARKRRVVYLARVQEYWRAQQRFETEITELKGTLTNLRDPLAQRTPFEQYIAQIQAERRKKPEETALQKDAEIVFANSAQKIAYMNLARKDGVFPGMTFDVYHFKKGGVPEKKGEVRVKNVGDDLSLVVILEEAFQLNPIQEGDFVVNEVFDRNKKKYFTFAGRLSGDYTNEQATRLIEELGHFVEPRITAKTDYVILGVEYSGDDNWIAAERLGIEQLTQGDLMRWLGKSK